MLKAYCVIIYLLMPNLYKRMCPLCIRELHLLPIFSVGLGASLVTINIQTICLQKKKKITRKNMKWKKYIMTWNFTDLICLYLKQITSLLPFLYGMDSSRLLLSRPCNTTNLYIVFVAFVQIVLPVTIYISKLSINPSYNQVKLTGMMLCVIDEIELLLHNIEKKFITIHYNLFITYIKLIKFKLTYTHYKLTISCFKCPITFS